jgi:mannitol/fructose-specific phosphotransferase system IIA component (Ntr-type)
VLDLHDNITAADLFRQLSEAAAERFGIDGDRLGAALIKGSTEHSNLIHPGHAVLTVESDGEQVKMVLVRIRQGLTLTAGDGAVHTLFVLLMPLSDRAFHLQALASIAQILRDPEFDRDWLEARTEQQLRDLILLGDRRRICLL